MAAWLSVKSSGPATQDLPVIPDGSGARWFKPPLKRQALVSNNYVPGTLE